MKPRISVLTLGVSDLEKSVEFYRDGLGFSTEGIIGKEFEYGAVAFFDLQSGVKLALWPRKSMANDTGIPVQIPSELELTIGQLEIGSTLCTFHLVLAIAAQTCLNSNGMTKCKGPESVNSV